MPTCHCNVLFHPWSQHHCWRTWCLIRCVVHLLFSWRNGKFRNAGVYGSCCLILKEYGEVWDAKFVKCHLWSLECEVHHFGVQKALVTRWVVEVTWEYILLPFQEISHLTMFVINNFQYNRLMSQDSGSSIFITSGYWSTYVALNALNCFWNCANSRNILGGGGLLCISLVSILCLICNSDVLTCSGLCESFNLHQFVRFTNNV